MAIEVRIPTILRQYTGGAKAVEGVGDTVAALIDDLESRHPGLRNRLVDGEGLRRFVNVYLNDEDVRFLEGLKTPVSDGDTVKVDVSAPRPGSGSTSGRCSRRWWRRSPCSWGASTASCEASSAPSAGRRRSRRTAQPPRDP